MKLGMSLPQAGRDVSVENIARVAREAEAIGLDSVWVLDRLFRPTAPVQRVPGEEPQRLPSFYGNVFDPIETLTYVAALTSRVLLGTSVVNALFHPPVILGKRFATLDQLSNGRVIAGLGQGWMREEFDIAGVPMSRRGDGMEEYVAALKAIWGPDPVSFEGRHYRIPPSDIGPKPLQTGGVPVLIGAFSPPAVARAGRVADGLNPLAADYDRLVAELETFRSAARDAGRDPATLPVIARANARLTAESLPEDGRPLFAGTPAQWRRDLDRVADLGVEHVFFSITAPIDAQLNAMRVLKEGID